MRQRRRSRCWRACATLRPQARITGFTVQPMVDAAAGAGTDRRRERRPGVRPGAAVRPGRHRRRGAGRPRDRAAAAEPRAGARAGLAHTRGEAAGRLSRPSAGATSTRSDDVLVAVSQMLADLPELAELDINPLWADHDGVIALDARLRVSREPGAGAERFAITALPGRTGGDGGLARRDDRCCGRSAPKTKPQHLAFVEQLAPRGPAAALLQQPARAAAQRAGAPGADRLRARDGVHRASRTLPDGIERDAGRRARGGRPRQRRSRVRHHRALRPEGPGPRATAAGQDDSLPQGTRHAAHGGRGAAREPRRCASWRGLTACAPMRRR